MRLRGDLETVQGEIVIDGVAVGELANTYGTPLYVYNALHIRKQCAAVMRALKKYKGPYTAYYASKAFPNVAIEKMMGEQGLGVDVASEGELRIALLAQIPPEKIIAHGINKPRSYIEALVQSQVGFVVVDSLGEIDKLEQTAKETGRTVDVLLRLNPGVEAETHKAVRTASLDNKFGIPIKGERATQAVQKVQDATHLNLRGVHCHVGSQVFKTDVFFVASRILLEFMSFANAAGSNMDVLNLGGGYGCWYSRGDTPMPLEESVQAVVKAVEHHSITLGMEPPHLMIEPGRSLVAEGAVALYRAGVVKEVPGVNHYLVIDGGLFENPRPLLYGARYTAFLAQRMETKPDRYYTISGMSCETDTLIQRIKLPRVEEGDLVAFVSAGAYQLSMASNYQRMPAPAAVLADDGKHSLIRRRQTLDELLAVEVFPKP